MVTVIHAGFCAGGPDWPYPEVEDASPARRIVFLEELGDAQATCIRHCGGDYLRVPFSSSGLLGYGFHATLFKAQEPPYAMSDAALAATLMDAERELDRALAALQGEGPDWSRLDAILRGVERANARDAASDTCVRTLLCLVALPPRAIVEAPPHVSGQPGFTRLWGKFLQVHILITRALVRRYCGPGRCLGALEIINEPDYNWIPDEQRIERALRPEAHPLNKYVTELHLSQIPETGEPCRAFHRTDGGYYIEQRVDTALVSHRARASVPVLEYPWGHKFDHYVACAASLMEHVAFAAKDESGRLGAELRVVSGAVTHNNVDYLIRMYRANRNVFRHVDAIGLHPYHWPNHDMHDACFVSKNPPGQWQRASPRGFAENHFKRFDFLEVVAGFTRQRRRSKSFGMAGKTLWLTEFGIPTKKCGHVNEALVHHRNLFIYRREDEAPEALHLVRWEDKWDAFLEQATPEFLAANRVETVLIYAMRAAGMGESTDEEHSNFTLFLPDCSTTRMERGSFERLTGWFTRLTGRENRAAYFGFGGAQPHSVMGSR